MQILLEEKFDTEAWSEVNVAVVASSKLLKSAEYSDFEIEVVLETHLSIINALDGDAPQAMLPVKQKGFHSYSD